MFVVTLTYVDGTVWIAGGFDSADAANAWIATEKTRPYWVETTIVNIQDNTPQEMEE